MQINDPEYEFIDMPKTVFETPVSKDFDIFRITFTPRSKNTHAGVAG